MCTIARSRRRFRWYVPIATRRSSRRRLVAVRRVAVRPPLPHPTGSTRTAAQPYPRLAHPLRYGIGHLNVDLVLGHAPGIANATASANAGVGVVGRQRPVSKFAARIITQIHYGGCKGNDEQSEGTERRRLRRPDILQARYVKGLVD